MSSAVPAALAPETRAAISRGRWSVIQTGLITTGLALFGVFAIASRLTESRVLAIYVAGWFPAGALLLGIIAGSGYLLGAWWFGVGVGARLLACILLLQLAGYFAAQYAEFQSLGLEHRRTREPVRFIEYFRYTTENWTPDALLVQRRDIGRWGYLVRAGEAALFCLGGAGAAVALVGKPRCPTCRGLLRRRSIGSIPADSRAAGILTRLEALAQAGDVRAFQALLARVAQAGSPADTVALELVSCAVCGSGYIESSAPPPGAEPKPDAPQRSAIHPRFAAALTAAAAATGTHSRGS